MSSAIPAWFDNAPCKGQLDVMFAGDKGDGTPEAKAICADCPHRAPCLEFAVAEEIPFGVWGGVGPRTRAKQRRGLNMRPRVKAVCGTIGGHAKHRSHREDACQPCKDAWNAYKRQVRAEQKRAAA